MSGKGEGGGQSDEGVTEKRGGYTQSISTPARPLVVRQMYELWWEHS